MFALTLADLQDVRETFDCTLLSLHASQELVTRVVLLTVVT